MVSRSLLNTPVNAGQVDGSHPGQRDTPQKGCPLPTSKSTSDQDHGNGTLQLGLTWTSTVMDNADMSSNPRTLGPIPTHQLWIPRQEHSNHDPEHTGSLKIGQRKSLPASSVPRSSTDEKISVVM